MAIECRTGSFLTGTGAVASTVEVNFSTAMAAPPTLVLFYFSGRTESVDTAGRDSHKRGFGAAVSASQRQQMSNFSLDASAAADTATRNITTECINIMLNATTVDGAFDLTSMDADGFTLDVTNQFATSYRVHYWAITGTTNVEIGAMTASLALGNVDTVLAGAFQPDALILIGEQTTSAPPSTAPDSMHMMGVATAATNQAVMVMGSNDAASTMDANSSANGSECVAIMASSMASIVARAAFVQFNADGFRLNWTEVSGNAHQMFYIAIQGGEWAVGDILTQTDTVTTIPISGLGFTPVGGLFGSVCAAEDALDAIHANDKWSLGGWSENATTRGTHAVLDEDNVANSEVSTAVEFDAVYANISTASAIQGLMDIQSVDADGLTLIMDDADPSQSFVFYLMCGNVAATGWEQLLSQRRNHLVIG